MNKHAISRLAKETDFADFLLAMENRERSIKQSADTKDGELGELPQRPALSRELRA